MGAYQEAKRMPKTGILRSSVSPAPGTTASPALHTVVVTSALSMRVQFDTWLVLTMRR